MGRSYLARYEFSRAWVSAKFIPARETLIRTSCSPGFGTGASSSTSRTSGPPNSLIWTALTSVSGYRGAAMSLAVVGSIAFDSVKTPFGERSRMLGGSAVHLSLAASFFTDVRVVGPVGDDFRDEEYAALNNRGINTDDIEQVE